MTAPVVSVVVPTRDRAQRLEKLLATLEEQSLPPDRFEVIVVDDASTDETGQVLDAARARGALGLRTLTRDRQGGPAAARNAGWRSAGAPLVAFTDDDCEPQPPWLAKLVEAADGDQRRVVQGRTEVAPSERSSIGPFSRVLEVTEGGPFYPTCNIAYPVRLLDQLDGFDESYPLPGGEDTDLAWRAREIGARIAFAGAAIVHHGVVDYGPLGKLQWALHWAEAMRVFARHPGLRRYLLFGVFWKRSHALLLLAIVGAVLARRFPPSVVLTLPYLRELRGRCIGDGISPAWAPYLALYDALETFAAASGSVRSGAVVL